MLNPIEAARERAEKRQNIGHSVPLAEILIRFISYLKENAERSITTAELSKELARHFRGVDVFGNVNLMQRCGVCVFFALFFVLFSKASLVFGSMKESKFCPVECGDTNPSIVMFVIMMIYWLWWRQMWRVLLVLN